MIKCQQINVGVCRAAQDVMEAMAAKLQVDVVFVSESNHQRMEDEGWFGDQGNKAAVMVVNSSLLIFEVGPMDSQGFRWIATEGIRVYACYWSPNTNFAAFENFLDRLEANIRSAGTSVFVAGDYHTKSPE